ncbi:peptidyl-prolyl cis-trans isomerase FKBP43-like [Humulus lupulus]|uniref:peptidyl-prolyl cis-trans isomerase FKBP43-like n=1 Tax=Humulus lupulus TaxID=3486 RepID=UPI002B416F91|nr:peptidyl-prolyl cis-trans isomerase FKBP43-like [Humulus lupulus]
MAFWGTEVKPGKPFTHNVDDTRGRLHISMASLGMGKATTKSVLQCNVGNKSPVFLCSLYPEKTESLQLNLEFEEVDEVVFSVVGPRSIHLSGYYLGSGGRIRGISEESESYGEDIADTDTQISDNSEEEEEFEDSFINDEDPEVFPPSPVYSDGDGVSKECGLEDGLDDKKRPDGKRNRRRLRKKYQLVESDDEEQSPKMNKSNGRTAVPVLDCDDEDNFPIFSCIKNRAAKKSKMNGEENAVKGTDEISNKMTEDDGNYNAESKGNTDDIVLGDQPTRQSDLPVDPLPSEVGHISNGISKKRKERSAEGSSESDKAYCDNVLNEVKMQQCEANTEDGQMQMMAHVNQTELPNVLTLRSTEVGHENDQKRKKKKKRKEQKNENKFSDVDSASLMNDVKENKDLQDDSRVASVGEDLSVKSEQIWESANDQSFDHESHGFTDKNQSEDKKVKKTKKKSRVKENGVVVNTDTLLLVEENNTSMKDKEPKTLQVRTLQNGLVVEELELGEQDGKVAFSKKKISVHYVGKLKNGEVVDSNVGSDPFKFRLGAGKVIQGWDVGLEGMRVGEKRRLTVPPPMGYGSEGDGKNIPPNSWLVYEVALVKVH